jgi:hypothetical protein
MDRHRSEFLHQIVTDKQQRLLQHLSQAAGPGGASARKELSQMQAEVSHRVCTPKTALPLAASSYLVAL